MTTPSIAIIIPTWKAAQFLPTLISQLRQQDLPPADIIIIDSSSPDHSAQIARDLGCTVIEIPQAEFNHGGTRNRAAQQATKHDILVFMTQDALPIDSQFLRNLTQPIIEQKAAAAYARQIAHPDASPLEKFARSFNYPPTPHLKSHADLARLGIKTYFFSDTASAVDAKAFWEVGAYPDWVIVNEDMILCARLLQTGHQIAYQANAAVYHSHTSSLKQVFQRYFDIGVFMTQAQEILLSPSSSGEGLRFALHQWRYLWQHAKSWLPRSLAETALKWLGFQIGKRSARLPTRLKRRFSGQKAFWNNPNA